MTTRNEIKMLLTLRKGKLATKCAMNYVSQSYKIQLLLLLLPTSLVSIFTLWPFSFKEVSSDV